MVESRPPPSGDSAAPNIVQILVDDLGFGDVGAYGSENLETPNIDALANSGVRCSQGYVSSAWCAPTRVSVLSGMQHNRVSAWDGPWMGAYLQEAGYDTGFVGKVHAHPIAEYDSFYGFFDGQRHYVPFEGDPVTMRRGGNSDGPISTENTESEVESAYLTDGLTREAVSFIEADHDDGFALNVHYNAPHRPMEAPERYRGQFSELDGQMATYAGMVKALDDGIGDIITALEDQGLRENTLITFVSDNGPDHSWGRGYDSNQYMTDSLRGAKHTFYEGGIRVPFIVSWPGVIEAGSTYDEVVSCLDLLPTFLATAGVEADIDGFDGTNIMPFLTGETDGRPHPTLYWERREYTDPPFTTRAERIGDTEATWIVRKPGWKLLGNDEEPVELYDMDADPGEQENLLAERPVDVDAWVEEWLTYREGEGDDWTPGYLPAKRQAREQGAL
jgi:arylsulfatase A-like enzyme